MGNAKTEQGKALYQQGYSLAEIAEKLGVSDSTVRSWKRRGNWPENATDATEGQRKTPLHFPAVAPKTQRKGKAPPKPKKEKSKMGRPPTGVYDVDSMVERIDAYAERCKAEGILPILKECCLDNNWSYDYVMQLQRQHEDLAQSIKKLLARKEIMLERGALSGDLDRTMAIFSLKQPAHGWSDKPVSNEGIELEDLTPLAEMLKDDKDTDDTVAEVQPET